MGLWHEIKVRLGLADDYEDDYEDEEYYDEPEDEQEAYPSRRAYRNPYGAEQPQTGVRRVNREPDIERAREATPLRAVPSAPSGGYGGGHAEPRPRDAQVKMHIVQPRSFSEAQNIADQFKQDIPVIMNLTVTDPDLSKRFIDFASGLTYGLSGGLQKVSDKVFMLTPANVDVSAEDRRRLKDTGLFTLE